MLKDLSKKNLDKSIVLIANSSKYLMHYRFLLIKELDAIYKNLFIIAPKDKFTNELNKKVRYKLWPLSPGMEFNFLKITKSFFVLFSLIKSIKPDLVHSHTLKPNLMISIVNSLFGIKTVLSFPGMGR